MDIPVSYSQPTTNYSLTLDGNEVVANHSSLTDLSDEEHTIVYATAANASLSPTFDFLSVVAGSRTKMKGRNVIVDDGDSAITYSGDGWRSSVMEPFTFPDGRGVYKDTLHFTRQVGDTLSFEFAGTFESEARRLVTHCHLQDRRYTSTLCCHFRRTEA